MLDAQLLFLLGTKITGDQNDAFFHLHNTDKWISSYIFSKL